MGCWSCWSWTSTGCRGSGTKGGGGGDFGRSYLTQAAAEGGGGDGEFASPDEARLGEELLVNMEVASSLVGEKKPVTEGEGAAPCRDACKGKKHKKIHYNS